MPYAWWCNGPDQFGVEPTREPANGIDRFSTFGEAKAALIRVLSSTRDAYRAAVTEVRLMRKSEM